MSTVKKHVIEYGEDGFIITPSKNHRIIFLGYSRERVLRMIHKLETGE